MAMTRTPGKRRLRDVGRTVDQFDGDEGQITAALLNTADDAHADPDALAIMLGGMVDDAIPSLPGVPREEFTRAVASALQSAIDADEDLYKTTRKDASKYYRAQPFGNEVKGQSQFVSSDLRDVVLQVLPAVMNVIFGAESPVAFEDEDDGFAAQATEYTRKVVLEQDNNFYWVMWCLLLDAYVRRLGVVRVDWEAESRTETTEHTGLTPEQAAFLSAPENVQDAEVQLEPETWGAADPMDGSEGMEGAPLSYRATITRQVDAGRTVMTPIPLDEFVVDPNTTNPMLTDAVIVGHRGSRTRSELVALGIPEDVLDEYGASTATGDYLDDRSEQNPLRRDLYRDLETDDSTRRIDFADVFVQYDANGDGKSEWVRAFLIGPSRYVWDAHITDGHPFRCYTPYIDAHTATGMSLFDIVKDVQETKSKLIRGALNSLAVAVQPRLGYVENQVSAADVYNPTLGAPIRMRSQGAVFPIVTPFTGEAALAVAGYFDQIREKRTGITPISAGLDAKAMQSSTAQAVDATVTAAQASTQFLTRGLIELFLKPLYRRVLRLLVQHQDMPRMAKLAGRMVQVDPRSWNADMSVTVTAAVSAGSTEQRMARLMGIKETQEQILQTLGPDNPLVSLVEYRNTLGAITELAGFSNAERFFKALPPNYQPQPQPPQPNPELIIAQAEAQKRDVEREQLQVDIQIKQAELTLKQREQSARLALELQRHRDEDSRMRQKDESDAALKELQIRLTYEAAMANVQQKTDAARQTADGDAGTPDAGSSETTDGSAETTA